MTTTSTTPTPAAPRKDDELPRVLRALAVVERVGNALPHPFWLFWILAGILAVGFAIKDFVIELRPLRIRRDRDHLNIVVHWRR